MKEFMQNLGSFLLGFGVVAFIFFKMGREWEKLRFPPKTIVHEVYIKTETVHALPFLQAIGKILMPNQYEDYAKVLEKFGEVKISEQK